MFNKSDTYFPEEESSDFCPPSIDDQIKECLEYIDWRRIHSVMKLLDWVWATADGIPTPAQLKKG